MSLQQIQELLPKQLLHDTPAEFQPAIPPLKTGQRLTRAEFHRRYEQHPEIKKAELIEGVVYVASPVRIEKHSSPHSDLDTWLGVYRAMTPGLFGGVAGSVWLDPDKNELQPDVFLCLEPSSGGQSFINADDYLEGAPELVIEVSASSVSYDLNAKKRVYARYGVQEYIVAQIYKRKLSWFQLQGNEYETLQPDKHGILKSEVFSGLWLDSVAFWAGDMKTVIQVLQKGMASSEYSAFVEQLQRQSRV
ncbi:Uma2 family endonuclease [Anaerolineales bacterium HSG6]|nr:Uma2 family endonuclease [Anaerolineales bacterium HSG6]